MSVFIKNKLNKEDYMLMYYSRFFVNFYCKISLCQSVYVQYVQVMTKKLNYTILTIFAL